MAPWHPCRAPQTRRPGLTCLGEHPVIPSGIWQERQFCEELSQSSFPSTALLVGSCHKVSFSSVPPGSCEVWNFPPFSEAFANSKTACLESGVCSSATERPTAYIAIAWLFGLVYPVGIRIAGTILTLCCLYKNRLVNFI